MGSIGAIGTKRFDPLLRDLPLRFGATFHPAGFPLRLACNSRDVMEAATESWGMWQPAFERDPVTLRVLVEREGQLASPPRYRMVDHLVHAVSDSHNFAVADCRTLSASICVSEKTAADHGWLRWFFVESMAYLLLSQRYLTALHAGCVAWDGEGILLCGISGTGKSTLAFACARAGFTYVADDCTWLVNGADDRLAIGRPNQIRFRDDAPRHFPELSRRVLQVRPNGKIGIELAMRDFPFLRTTPACPIRRIVFLNRNSGHTEHLEPVRPEQAYELLLRDMPSYGDEVNVVHQATVARLTEVPAFLMHYRRLDDGIRLLSEIP